MDFRCAESPIIIWPVVTVERLSSVEIRKQDNNKHQSVTARLM